MEKKIVQAVLLAGGHGTRLQPFTDTMPKPMYAFEGKPFLDYLLRQLESFGIKEVVLLLGYLPDKIMNYAGDGSRYGLQIRYDVTPVDYDTGDRLKHAAPMLREDFLLLYCDNYCPVDFKVAQREYFEKEAWVQITAYANKDNYTKDNILVDETGQVRVYDKSRSRRDLAGVDIGYAFVKRKALKLLPAENVNFEAWVYPRLTEVGRLYAYLTEHRYYSVGSWERIGLTQEFFRPKKVVFLDRDGTLNKRPPVANYIIAPEELEWLEGAQEAVRMLKENGFTLILVTNQPGIARGFLTEQDLEQIHKRMQRDLEQSGGHIDFIYACLHGWDDGCECRKPKPGLLFQAQKELSLDLSQSVLFGDDERDLDAGRSAGCRACFLVTEEDNLEHQVKIFLESEKRVRG